MRRIAIPVTVLVGFVMLGTAFAGMVAQPLPVVSEAELKAEYIWRFTLFTEWPARALGHDDEVFVIGVVGNGPVAGALTRRAAERQVKERAVMVRLVESLDQLSGCHLLFIDRNAPLALDDILRQTADRPVLTVADSEGCAERGVLINLLVVDDRVRFEINPRAVRLSGLEIRSKLYRVARIVGEELSP